MDYKREDHGECRPENPSRRAAAWRLLGLVGSAAIFKGCAAGAEPTLDGLEDIDAEDLGAGAVAALTGTAIRWFDTMSELAAHAGTTDHEVAILLGYHAAGDGGGGIFYWDLASTAGDDGGTIIAASGGRWRRTFSGRAHVEWWGAKGDGATNDSDAIANAIFYCQARAKTLALGTGRTYYCEAPVGAVCSIDGEGATIKGSMNVSASNVRIANLTINSGRALAIYIFGVSCENLITAVTLENVTVTYQNGASSPSVRNAINAAHVSKLAIRDCRLQYGTNLVDCPHFLFSGNACDGEGQNESELLHITLKSFGVVDGNLFINSLNDPMDLYSSGERTIISNNRFDGCRSRYGTCVEIKITLTDTMPIEQPGPSLLCDQDQTNRSSNDNGWCEAIVLSNNIFTALLMHPWVKLPSEVADTARRA